MGKTRDKMIQDLQLRRYAPSTCKNYVDCARAFVAYHGRPAEQMGEREVRQFLLHLVLEKKAGAATQKMHVAGIRFLYTETLGRPEVVAHIPWPKVRQALPPILSGTEVDRLLGAVESVKYRAIIMTTYGSGLRISEVCRLRTDDIDSRRMLIHIRHGKGDRDRYVTLPERVLFTLRKYWKLERPKGPALFAGQQPGSCVSDSAVRNNLRAAAEKAKLTKRVTPHCLRHSFGTHLLELGTDLRVIQMLLGHRSIRTTLRYTRVTDKHLARVVSPVDVLGTPKAKLLG
jgi:site-specific recombinase XerD